MERTLWNSFNILVHLISPFRQHLCFLSELFEVEQECVFKWVRFFLFLLPFLSLSLSLTFFPSLSHLPTPTSTCFLNLNLSVRVSRG
ncbi:hypothetical protein H0H93_005424, partial [Arthromyces matolae]